MKMYFKFKHFILMIGLLTISLHSIVYANDAYVEAIGGICPPGPNSGLSDLQVYKLDQWSFFKCECTSYVAWKLENDGIEFHNQYGGVHFSDAKTWKVAAENLSIPVDNIPRTGDIAWWDNGTWGHVAYVDSVNSDGSANISEYNKNLDHSYTTRTVRANAYIHNVQMLIFILIMKTKLIMIVNARMSSLKDIVLVI